MIESIPILSPLFAGIAPEEGKRFLERLGATVRYIRRGDYVFHAGTIKRNFGVLLSGELEIFETDSDGRRLIVRTVQPAESFAQVFAFAKVERHPASVVALTDSTILVIPLAQLMPVAGREVDAVHSRFLQNFMTQLCEDAWTLRSRGYILSRRSTEERLISYLRQRMNAEGSPAFTIPFDRQGLADFLCVDRSALSSVMSKMAMRGLLGYHKNHFVLKGYISALPSNGVCGTMGA